MINISPIYFFIKELQEENSKLLEEHTIDELKKDSREYLLIRLKTPKNPCLIDDCPLKEAHFSIDKFFNPSTHKKHGLTRIHYTETYLSLIDGTQKVVHGYLNAKGEHEYSKIKNSQDTLTLEQTRRLEENIQHHKEFLGKILREYNIRTQTALQTSNNLELELTRLSQDLNQKNIRTEYLKTALQFIHSVKIFNQYSENKDVRDKIILNMFKNIEVVQSFSQEKTSQPPIDFALCETETEEELKFNLPIKTSIQAVYKAVEKIYLQQCKN